MSTSNRRSQSLTKTTGCNPAETTIGEYLSRRFGRAPKPCWICISHLNEKEWKNGPFRDVASPAGLAALVTEAEHLLPTHSLYYTELPRKRPYSGGARGDVASVASVDAFWCELDINKDHPPDTIEESIDFLLDLPVIPSAIILSGNGVHGKWFLDEAFRGSKEAMQAMLERFGSAIRAALPAGWRIDSVFNPDRSMRLPGSVNHKEPKDLKPVEVTYPNGGQIYTLKAMDALLSTVPEEEEIGEHGPWNWDPDDQVADAEVLTSMCAVYRSCGAAPEQLSNDEWRVDLRLSLACKGGEKLVYERSEDYPGYTPAETTSQINRLKNYPPYTCEQIAKTGRLGYFCERCAQRGKVTTPVQLAMPRKPQDNSDLGNARRLISAHKDSIIFCPEKNLFYLWNGNFFQPDRTNGIHEMAHDLVDKMRTEIPPMTKLQRKAYLSWQKKSQSDAKLTSMVSRASKIVSVGAEELDKDPLLLQVRNGRIELECQRFVESSKVDRRNIITNCSNTHFDPDADPERFAPIFVNDFLNKRFKTPEERIYVQTICGLCLTGLQEKIIILIDGPTDTGKTTFTELILDILGDYGAKVSSNLFLRKMYTGSDEYALARIAGKRLIVASESPKGASLNEGLVKEISGGARFVGREPRGMPFEIAPTMKIFFDTNNPPILRETSAAMLGRIKRIRMTERIENPDPLWREYLKPEYPAILNWMLEGLRLYMKDGLVEPKSVTEAVEEYAEEQNVPQRFLDEVTIPDSDSFVSGSDLWEVFRAWCVETGETYTIKHETQTSFGRWLSDHEPPFSPDKKVPGHGGYVMRMGLQFIPRIKKEIEEHGINSIRERHFHITDEGEQIDLEVK